jgi:hypothetical protein
MIRQSVIISGREDEPIPFSPLLFALKSGRYLEELLLGSGSSDIVIDHGFDRDSVVQFIAACESGDFDLTLANVFEIEVLCDQWSVNGKSIRQKLAAFIQHPPSSQSLCLRRLLFRLCRGLFTTEAEDSIRCNLISLICDSAALEIPAAVLSRIVDFREYEGRSEEHARLFAFCIEYLRAHGSAASQILKTLDVARLTEEDLGRLYALEPLNWGILSESVGRSLITLRHDLLQARQQNDELRNEVEQQRREIKNLANEVEEQRKEISNLNESIVRQQSAKAVLEAEKDEQFREIRRLEAERNEQQGMVGRLASEIESLKAEK